MRHRKSITWHTSQSEYGTGSWAVIDGMVFVRTAHGTKATQVGGSPPETIARFANLQVNAATARN